MTPVFGILIGFWLTAWMSWKLLSFSTATEQQGVYDGGDECIEAPGLCSLINPSNASVDLGGLVIKAALTYADRARSGHLEHHKAVKDSTYGVLYMGTPHQGADKISLLKVIVRITALYEGKHADDKLLDDLRSFSPFLEELQDTYNAISGDFETTFFYETLPTPVHSLGPRLMMVPKNSAIIPGAVNAESIRFDADHLTIVKYDSIENAKMQIIGIIPMEFRVGLELPQIRNPSFTGREYILKNMSELLHSDANDGQQSLVLFNLGGVGKTQIALEFAYRAEHNFSSTFWIDGSTQETVFYSIRDILKSITSHYRANGLETNNPRFRTLEEVLSSPGDKDWRYGSGYEYSRFERLRDAFRQWLSYSENRNWLVILDNVNDLESYNFRQLLPVKPWGSVLITTTRTDLTVTWKSVEVLEMDESECVDLLRKTSGLALESKSEGGASCSLRRSLPTFSGTFHWPSRKPGHT
ncbi:hypothetical protein ASPACDRAFT_61966 [Aspergillus aculeatus ATCC 16872]|uniref:NB-ARC domain-containing protein n=1 Tax=Aspergillus aculeatus (strain ATCC 16872 / CBS 172.66 / WB 5094) TaxID=690307 RepID=A0A1L9WQI8_ASPA1|nr:uncharacterized protein ASPACDRAFT_61966 [Aspergillus aculeatus ATCC 16872]OJJ98454.1 hypothetical protein ASPACDRAFT_61966 [Aspergillus aculeatus ATCC 16872]